jgi:hypothetical protein
MAVGKAGCLTVSATVGTVGGGVLRVMLDVLALNKINQITKRRKYLAYIGIC